MPDESHPFDSDCMCVQCSDEWEAFYELVRATGEEGGWMKMMQLIYERNDEVALFVLEIFARKEQEYWPHGGWFRRANVSLDNP
jgi:hypothetical protein